MSGPVIRHCMSKKSSQDCVFVVPSASPHSAPPPLGGVETEILRIAHPPLHVEFQRPKRRPVRRITRLNTRSSHLLIDQRTPPPPLQNPRCRLPTGGGRGFPKLRPLTHTHSEAGRESALARMLCGSTGAASMRLNKIRCLVWDRCRPRRDPTNPQRIYHSHIYHPTDPVVSVSDWGMR